MGGGGHTAYFPSRDISDVSLFVLKLAIQNVAVQYMYFTTQSETER